MFEKYKDGDLITLKLASGEEVIANYKGNDDSSVSIEKSLVLMQGPQGLAFGTFFSTARQEEIIKIAKAQVIAIAYINDKIEGEYKRIFSTIQTPPKPKIIT
jgi:endo-alpha-1,4-polygalactosaminidase (GH114 family)